MQHFTVVGRLRNRSLKLPLGVKIRVRNHFDVLGVGLYLTLEDKILWERCYKRIAHRYSRLIMKELKQVHVVGYELDDLMQEAFIVVHKVMAREYRPELGIPFWPFLRMCIRRRLYSLISTAHNQRNTSLNGSFGWDELSQVSGSEWVRFTPFVKSHENQIIDRLAAGSVIREMKVDFSDLEYKAFLEKNAYRLSYNQISEKYGYRKKQIDNALRRAERKLEEIRLKVI